MILLADLDRNPRTLFTFHVTYSVCSFLSILDTFYNKVVCEGDLLRLKCNKSYRIVIFSASFGSTRFSVPECPLLASTKGPGLLTEGPKINEECQVSYATETVMSSCHGKRKCVLDADRRTFGDPGCSKEARLHLKVVHTCIPKEVLKELNAVPGDPVDKSSRNSESDNLLGSTEDDLPDDLTDDYAGFVGAPQYVPDQDKPSPSPSSGHISESYVKVEDVFSPTKGSIDNSLDSNNKQGIDPAADLQETSSRSPALEAVGHLSNWMSTYRFLRGNH